MKTFTEEIIATENRTELDLEYPHYEGDEENNVIIPYDKLKFHEVPSLDLGETIEILTRFKEMGANRVYISEHIDHHGYIFTGVKLSES